jgi:hypothetical protein
MSCRVVGEAEVVATVAMAGMVAGSLSAAEGVDVDVVLIVVEVEVVEDVVDPRKAILEELLSSLATK